MAGKPANIETRLFINGEFVESSKTFPIYTPFDESLICNVHIAEEKEVNLAVAAAKAAFPAWDALGAVGRAPYLTKFAELLRKHSREIGLLETMCLGRPIKKMQHEPAWSASMWDNMRELSLEIGGTTKKNTPGSIGIEIRQPYGVVGLILPWNVPAAMWAFKCAPALAAGNTIVLKSSEKSPLSSLKLARLIEEAGFPKGVVNVLSGFGAECGGVIASHADIRKISFTGSTATGRIVQMLATNSNQKTVTLELGGKSPCIVFADAPDLQGVAAKAAASMLHIGGQMCIASSRIYVEESIADQFVALFKKEFEKVGAEPIADPTILEAVGGVHPVADKIQFERVMSFIEEGKKQNPECLITGGTRVGTKGYFIKPTVFFNLPDSSRLVREEIFASVVCVSTFKTEAEVVARANDSEYGLAASFFTKDISRAMRMARLLETGMVFVNSTTPDMGTSNMPFGGWKASGQGKELGMAGLDAYLEKKSVCIAYEESFPN